MASNAQVPHPDALVFGGMEKMHLPHSGVLENACGFLHSPADELSPLQTLQAELETIGYAIAYVQLNLNAWHASAMRERRERERRREKNTKAANKGGVSGRLGASERKGILGSEREREERFMPLPEDLYLIPYCE